MSEDPIELSYTRIAQLQGHLNAVKWPWINNPISASVLPLGVFTAAIDLSQVVKKMKLTREDERDDYMREYYIKLAAFLGATTGATIATTLLIPGALMPKFNSDFSKFSDLWQSKLDFSSVEGERWDKLKHQEFWDDALNVFYCMLFIAALTVGGRLLFAHLGNAVAQVKGVDSVEYKQSLAYVNGALGDSQAFISYCQAWLHYQCECLGGNLDSRDGEASMMSRLKMTRNSSEAGEETEEPPPEDREDRDDHSFGVLNWNAQSKK